MSEFEQRDLVVWDYPLIVKNGFEFYYIPIEFWNSNDYCLACHDLPEEQTTVEFSGSWYDADGNHFDKFYILFQIFVDSSSSKWVYIDSVTFQYRTTGGGPTKGSGLLGPRFTYDVYALIQSFNPYDAFDFSKLTLTSPDRLDAKGTYYINWQTYQFQNNGEQLIKDAIKPEHAEAANYIRQTFGLLLRGLRELGIEEWLPGDTKKSNIEKEADVLYLPWYMILFFMQEKEPEKLIYEIDLSGL